jgi:hypothetical protein
MAAHMNWPAGEVNAPSQAPITGVPAIGARHDASGGFAPYTGGMSLKPRPLVAINGLLVGDDRALKLANRYADAVLKAGGIPVAIPPVGGPSDVERLLERGENDVPADLDGPASAARVADVIHETPGDVHVIVKPGEGRWFVTSQPWYPGWRVRVNRKYQPLWRANYAFCAVEVPQTKCLVELEYDPPAFRLAGWIALGATLLLIGWLFASRRALSI